MRRSVIVAVFAVVIMRAETQAQCDPKRVVFQMDIAFKPKLTEGPATVRIFDQNGVWFQDYEYDLTPKSNNVLERAFYPEELFIVATTPQQRSTLCVRGKGRQTGFEPCKGTFRLELTSLRPSRSIEIEPRKAAAVAVRMEIPRVDGRVCMRLVDPAIASTQTIDVADGENVALAVKRDPADKPPSTFPCIANVAAAKSGIVPVEEHSGRGSPSTTSREFAANCQYVTVRVRK